MSQSRATGKRILYLPITRYSGGKPQKYQVQAVTLVDQVGDQLDLIAHADALVKESKIQTEILLRILSGKNEDMTRADIQALLDDKGDS